MSTYTIEQVRKHNTTDSCWIIINDKIYDVTSFLGDHPGGKNILLSVGGQDCTDSFDMFHRPKVLDKYGSNFYIGTISK